MTRSLIVGVDDTDDSRNALARAAELALAADSWWSTSGISRSSRRCQCKSVYQWRRAWRAGGDTALASRGPGGYGCKLDEQQLARLRAALDSSPAAAGWDTDQRWTLARVTGLITVESEPP